jgi:NADPH-dependent ferric siderophore reductase
MSPADPFVVAHTTIEDVARISPSFMRLTFAGPNLDCVGTPGQTYDQRIKIIVPAADGTTRPIPTDESNWYDAWLALPEHERGDMRTYSVRELRTSGTSTRLVVDVVRHQGPGHEGPGAHWARTVTPGATATVIAPRRGCDGGGIEYRRDARQVLLAGDETALPAIARILEDAPRDLRGAALIEVPFAADAQRIDAPCGVDVTWLHRGGRPHGARLMKAVLGPTGVLPDVPVGPDEDSELVWETPTYSSAGDELRETPNPSERFYWIAGESRMVTTIRRHLVTDHRIARAQVAFMGYWRMSS